MVKKECISTNSWLPLGAIKKQVHELKRKSKHVKIKVEKALRCTSMNLVTEKEKWMDPFQQNNKQKMWILITCTRFHLLKLSPKAVYTLTSLRHTYVESGLEISWSIGLIQRPASEWKDCKESKICVERQKSNKFTLCSSFEIVLWNRNI